MLSKGLFSILAVLFVIFVVSLWILYNNKDTFASQWYYYPNRRNPLGILYNPQTGSML